MADAAGQQRQGRRACAGGRSLRAARKARRVRGRAHDAGRAASRRNGCRSLRCCWSPRYRISGSRWAHGRSAEAHASARQSRSWSRRLRPQRSRPGPGGQLRLVRRARSAMTLRDTRRRRCATPTAATSASSTCSSRDRAQRQWIQERIEPARVDAEVRRRRQKRLILRAAHRGRDLERYLHTRYVGQKRFSLRGRREPDPVASTS